MSKSIRYYSSVDNKQIHKYPKFVRVAYYQQGGQKNTDQYDKKEAPRKSQ